jgi:hypothetical protein
MTKAPFVVGGILVAAGCCIWVLLTGSHPAAVRAGEKTARTPLYAAFDPEKTTEKYVQRFKEASSHGASSGLAYTPLGEVFRVSHIQGKLSDDDLKAVLADLQTDFVALAKASGVKAADPKSTIGDRPIALLMPFSGVVDMHTLRGFYITYEGGAIDVFADKRGKEAQAEWRILCLLHEKE